MGGWLADKLQLSPEVRKELKNVWGILWPITVTNGLLMLLQIEDQIILGRLGVDELAASALGTTVFNLAYFFLAGAASAVDTLVAQAYGARDFAGCERWTKMGVLIMTLLSIPAMVIFNFGEWVVRNIFRQEGEIAHMAGRYTQLLLPGLWPLCIFIVYQKSMQARGVLLPCLYIGVVSNVLNLLGNWVFVYVLELGFIGSPLATSTSRIATCLMTVLYYYCGGMKGRKGEPALVQGHSYVEELRGEEPADILNDESNDGSGSGNGNRRQQRDSHSQPAALASASSPSSSSLREPLLMSDPATDTSKPTPPPPSSTNTTTNNNQLSFRDALIRFLKLAIPGGIMVGLEAWSFDWTVTFSAQFGTEALDAHQSMMSISAFTYLTVPLAVSIAASIRVGNLLGAQRPAQAKLAARICTVIGVSSMLCIGLIIVGLRNYLGAIFSPDAKVQSIVAKLAPIMALYQVFDAIQGVSAGVLRGMGRQAKVALLNLGGFWVLGLPTGAALAFKAGLGVFGIWWGFNLGLMCISVLYWRALQGIDYEVEARRALKNAVTDLQLEHAWEETLEHEEAERAGVV